MLTHSEASLLMGLSLEKILAFMRRYGHHYPVLYALNRGSPADLRGIRNESVLNVDSEEREPTDAPDKVYRSLLGFKLQGEQDEKNIQAAADEVARTRNPDAIGLLMACLYAEYDDVNAKVPATLKDEPDAWKVLHLCYWTREDPMARITQAPFETDGEHATGEEIELASQPGNEVNYGVVAVAYPWTCEFGRLVPKIRNPYQGSKP